MNIFNMPYNKKFLLNERIESKEKIYLEKVIFPQNNRDQYFIKIYKTNDKGSYICKGYIYFYLDLLNRESNFIGEFVKPEYRDDGLGQLLISYWVNLCLENGIYNLNTSHKQRKPFIVYLLKKFKFDILNIAQYEISLNTISVCKKDGDKSKYLFFKNPLQAATFKNSKILESDNYLILDSLNENTQVLDQVLLSTEYISQDNEEAYKKSLNLIDKFKNE